MSLPLCRTYTKAALLFSSFLFAAALSCIAGTEVPGMSSDFRTTTSRADFTHYAVKNPSQPASVADLLREQLSTLRNKNAELQLTHSSTSPAAYHYTFTQTYKGIPIYQSDSRVNVSKQGQVLSIFDNTYDVSRWVVSTTDFDYALVPAYTDYVKSHMAVGFTASAQKMIAYDEVVEQPLLCYLVALRHSRTGQLREVLVAKDRIIYEHDAAMYARAAAPDSVVSGFVFNPDPLTTAHVPYGGQYQDYNDSDVVALNAQRQSVKFTADFDGTHFALQNNYVVLSSLAGQVNPVTTTAPDFHFTRHQTGFEDVMVFYHLNVFRAYLHGLGFNAGDTVLITDPHGTTQDQSFFSQPSNIYYGTGGIDDAEDADVLIHEYTHFLSWNANGSGTGTTERSGLDEGTADYNAASYSRSIDTFGWTKVFNWDGNPPFWSGRVVNNTTLYANVQRTNYKLGTVWASALMDIWTALGRSTTDSLVMQTLYSFAGNTTLPQAAQLLVQSDTLFYHGAHFCQINQAFAKHGIVPLVTCTVGITEVNEQNTIRFTAYPDAFSVRSVDGAAHLTVDLYDITGQHINTYTNATDIKPAVSNGIYLIQVSSDLGEHQAFKWIKRGE
jgi:hypothetical protein